MQQVFYSVCVANILNGENKRHSFLTNKIRYFQIFYAKARASIIKRFISATACLKPVNTERAIIE